MFYSEVPRYIAFFPSVKLVSITFEKELLVSRGLFNVQLIPDYWMSVSNLHSKLLNKLRSCWNVSNFIFVI